jgi:hypothetical protein
VDERFMCSFTSAFFVLGDARRSSPREKEPDEQVERIVQAVSAFQQRFPAEADWLSQRFEQKKDHGS